jgi:hypothetical protein
LEVHNFSGYVRVGITKQIFCEATEGYVHAAKGHCYFPAVVCEKLCKFLPIAKVEADDLDKQVNGFCQTGALARSNRPSRFVPAKPAQRRVDGHAAPLTFADSNSASEHQSRGKRRADEYKTDGKEDEASTVEQGSPKKLNVDEASEEAIVAKKTQGVERSNVFRRH